MPEVKIYALSYCPWCKKTKKFFADRGIAVQIVDYDLVTPAEQLAIIKEIRPHSGGDVSFPCTIINGTYVIGHHPERYIELLGLNEQASAHG